MSRAVLAVEHWPLPQSNAASDAVAESLRGPCGRTEVLTRGSKLMGMRPETWILPGVDNLRKSAVSSGVRPISRARAASKAMRTGPIGIVDGKFPVLPKMETE